MSGQPGGARSGEYEMGERIASSRAMLRCVREQRCTSCPKQSRLVSAIYLWTDGTPYLWLPGLKVTDPVTGRPVGKPARAIPFHNEPDGRPHVELTRCPRCHQGYLLEIDGSNVVITATAGPATRGRFRQ